MYADASKTARDKSALAPYTLRMSQQDSPNEVGSKEVEETSPAHHDNNPVPQIPTPLTQRLQHNLITLHVTHHVADIM